MPEDQKVTRKLRAILSADVKGYSILMADDEVHTIQTLKSYRQIMSNLIAQYSGRVVDSPGDNMLAEFGSAVDAVECAIEIQKWLKKENTRFIEDRKLRFRIGVNIGDVLRDGDRIYGSGVNVAARIEGLSDPGGICISRNTYDHVKDKLDLGFEYLGEQDVKNIKEPIRVYKVLLDTESPKPLVEEQLKLPDKPSIAVLPFTNMSGDPKQEYFSDGLTEQIINGLSMEPNLFVVASNSSFAYKGKSIGIKQIAKELNVRYTLEGSVQRSGDRVRITAQLIDAITDYLLWSRSFDGDLNDIFKFQDEITLKILHAMEVKLTMGEQALIHEGGIRNLQAFENVARGWEYFNRTNKHDNAQARLFFKRAVSLDENFADGYAWIGNTHLYDYVFNWTDSPLESFSEAEKYAHKSLELNDAIEPPHLLLAYIHLTKGDFDFALKEAKRAVRLVPSGADAHYVLGEILCHKGEPEMGRASILKAIRLNPFPPAWYYVGLGKAYVMLDQFEKAIEALNASIKIDQESIMPYLLLASCYIDLGNFEDAKICANRVLEIDPHFSLEYHKNKASMIDQIKLERYIEALRKAGLPD